MHVSDNGVYFLRDTGGEICSAAWRCEFYEVPEIDRKR